MNSCRLFIAAFLTVAFLAAFPVSVNPQAQQKVDVEKEMIKRINNNNQVKAELVKKFTGRNVNGSTFKVTGFTLAGSMKQVGVIRVQAGQLSEDWEFLGAVSTPNCTDIPLNSASETLTSTIRDTVTVTKTMNLSYTQHAEAKIAIEIVSISGGWSATVGYSQSWQDSSFEEYSVSRTLTSDLVPAHTGLVKALLCKKTQADSIPYTATFEPTDNTSVIISMMGTNGSANVYEHFNYGGNHASLDWNQVVPDLNNCRFADLKALNKKISSLKVFGGAQVFMFARPNYAGNSRIYSAHTSQITDFNDKCRSLKVVPVMILKTVKFKEIKNLLPVQIRQFESSGSIRVSRHFGDILKVQPYQMSEEELQNECNSSNSYGGAMATSGTVAGAGSGGRLRSKHLTKAQLKALLQAGKIRKH